MMERLADFSIETDQTVLLRFANGSTRREPFSRLGAILNPVDLRRVQQSMTLRHQFLRRHMPRWLVALATVGVVGFGCVAGGHQLADRWSRLFPHQSRSVPAAAVPLSSAPVRPVTSAPPTDRARVQPASPTTPAASAPSPIPRQTAVLPRVDNSSTSYPSPPVSDAQTRLTRPITQPLSQVVVPLVAPLSKTVDQVVTALPAGL